MKTSHSRPGFRRAMLAVVLCAAGTGCRTMGNRADMSPTDRLMDAYEDLSTGRFAIIADFEDPAHAELVSAGGAATAELDGRAGRAATGRSALRVEIAASGDSVRFNNEQAQNWFLKRDWSSFDLLLMSVKSPQEHLGARIVIAAGEGDARNEVESYVALEKGWNTTRLDLAEAGEHVALDDVRELRIEIDDGAQPATLVFDDIVLASNRETVFGDPAGEAGSMFVQRVGRRWRIGAADEFELVFAHGQIVGWYDLARDPERARNLAAGTTVSPMPIVLDEGGPAFASLGRALRIHPRIVEISPVRVVVVNEWIFVDSPSASIVGRPFQRWRYTIYPTGQVFVSVASTAEHRDWSARAQGLMIGLTAMSEDGVQTRTAGDPESPPTYAMVSSEAAGYSLLFALGEPLTLTRTLERRDDGAREIAFTALGGAVVGPVARWECMLTLTGGRAMSESEAHERALSYWEPPAITAIDGSVVPAGSPHVTPTGFDRESGSYRLSLEDGACRFQVGDGEAPVFSPAFTVLDTKGREAWVYVDHLLYPRTGRDTEGNVVFQLPESARGAVRVEVLTRASRGGPDA